MLIADLLPDLLVDVPMCPQTLAERQLLLAAIDLCMETSAWNEIQDPIALIDGEHTYDIELPKDAQVALVMQAWLPDGPILPQTMAQITALLPNWQSALGSRPLWLNCPASGSSVRVFPAPAQAQRVKMTLRVAYMPTQTATTLPDALVDQNRELILCGARARLMLQPGKAWSSPVLGGVNETKFTDGKVDLRIAVMHDFSTANLVVQPRPLG